MTKRRFDIAMTVIVAAFLFLGAWIMGYNAATHATLREQEARADALEEAIAELKECP